MIVNGVRWRVRLVSPAHPLLLTPWFTHAYGVCDKTTQTICVDKTLSPQKLKEVLSKKCKSTRVVIANSSLRCSL